MPVVTWVLYRQESRQSASILQTLGATEWNARGERIFDQWACANDRDALVLLRPGLRQ